MRGWDGGTFGCFVNRDAWGGDEDGVIEYGRGGMEKQMRFYQSFSSPSNYT